MSHEEEYRMWVGGQWRDGSGELLPVEDPSTGEIIARVHTADPSDVDTCLTAATTFHSTSPWAHLPRATRAAILNRIATLLPLHLPRLLDLETRQTGRPRRELAAQLPTLARWFEYQASLLLTLADPVIPTVGGKLHNFVTRRPLGVVVLITPFNHPLLIAVKKLAPALAAGCTVVLKPSELAPLTALALGGILRDAGVLDGAFSVLPGSGEGAGRALVGDGRVKGVDVTGGTGMGREVGRMVGGNLGRFNAELGGKAPVVVFDRADVGAAVNGVAFAGFMAAGQTCVAGTRVLVQRGVVEEVREGLLRKMEGIRRRMGSPSDERCMMGPVISQRQLERIEELVRSARQEGLTVVAGGDRMMGKSELDGSDLSKGYYYPPTLIEAPEGVDITTTKVWREEIFGPVLVMQTFDTEDEAVKLANDSEFGLGAAIWTQDISQAYRVSDQIEAGICWVNAHHRNSPASPWGGVKNSGVGSENGVEAYYAYTTMKSTIISYASPEEMRANEDWFGEDAKDVRYG